MIFSSSSIVVTYHSRFDEQLIAWKDLLYLVYINLSQYLRSTMVGFHFLDFFYLRFWGFIFVSLEFVWTLWIKKKFFFTFLHCCVLVILYFWKKNVQWYFLYVLYFLYGLDFMFSLYFSVYFMYFLSLFYSWDNFGILLEIFLDTFGWVILWYYWDTFGIL